MSNYKAQKIVEQLLINKIIYKETKYMVIDCINSVDKNKYIIHNLQAEIEDGIIWFGENEILNIPIESIQDADINDNEIIINLNENKQLMFRIIR
jgi:hypothetical protein